ncbi:amidohydrolase family protein [Candidatus Uhrbacteria bacterium]|nr:amidohydrolase family protein [Candidatus Uhrbacteria bacterium]
MSQPWNLKQQFLGSVKQHGGWYNCHAHFDKAFYISKPELDKSMLDMEVKWNMSDAKKRSMTQKKIEDNIRTALDIMVAQGVAGTVSFVDAYEAVGHKAIDAANIVKKEYAKKIKFVTMTQPLGGLVDPAAVKLFEEITAKADVIGGLPSKDRKEKGGVQKHYDVLFSIAKNQNKPLHIHIDQENNPHERDTEELIRQVEKHKYQGRVAAIHAISVSAQPKAYRQKIYKKLAANGIAVVVCPSAALGMRQLDAYKAPVHNSIANVPEMLEAGVLVGLGVDNVYDFYQPFVDGDMWVEVRMLQEACRFYDFDAVLKIATDNGKKILEMK